MCEGASVSESERERQRERERGESERACVRMAATSEGWGTLKKPVTPEKRLLADFLFVNAGASCGGAFFAGCCCGTDAVELLNCCRTS